MAIMLGTPGWPTVGFGSQTNGHLDYPTGTWIGSTPGEPTTFTVTTLDAEGTGSITDAWSEDGRLIEFSVAGEIDFSEITDPNVIFNKSYITIDGLSAPYPGITFTNVASLKVSAQGGPGAKYPVHDVIIRGIRCIGRGAPETGEHRWEFERGADNHGWDLWELNGSESVNVVGYPSGDANVYRFVFDRCTTDGSGNGNMELYGDVDDVTIQNCFWLFSAQGQHMSFSSAIQRRVTYWHNVYGWCGIRQPRWRYAKQQVDYVGNVIYGWLWCEGTDAGAAYLSSDGEGGSDNTANFEKNTYLYVEGTDTSVDNVAFEASTEGTYADGYVRMHSDGQNNLPSSVVLGDWRDQYFMVRDHSSTSSPGNARGNNGPYQLVKVNTANDDWEIRKANLVNTVSNDASIEIPELAATPENITIRTRGPRNQEPESTLAGSWSGDLYIPDSGDDSNIWSQAVLDSSTFQTNLAALQTSATRISMVHNGVDYIAPRTVPNIRKVGHPYPTAEEIEMLEIIATEAGQ